ncbi:MAG: hypothetical protein WCD79_12425 [Chthoniobacteraceae bacterium]
MSDFTYQMNVDLRRMKRVQSAFPLSMKFPLIAFCLSMIVLSAKGDDSDRDFTFNFDQSGQAQILPVWMTGQPSASPSSHASISFPITPPSDDSDLAVTLYFTEVPGGFLRVYWVGLQKSETLSDNLYEGIGMPNQRTLLIKRSTLSSAGTLTIQSSETTLNVSKIHWAWVKPTPVSLAYAAKQSALIDTTGRVFSNDEVDGTPLLSMEDQVHQSIVKASLTYKPERIEAGVEFVATLQALPQYARLEVQISGTPIDKALQLTLNGALLGDVSVEIPDLKDPGYQGNDAATPAYIGWRKGVIYLPVGQLKVGDNQFQFGVKDTPPSSGANPIAIKDLVLQLKYPDVQNIAPPVSTVSGTSLPVTPEPTLSGSTQ